MKRRPGNEKRRSQSPAPAEEEDQVISWAKRVPVPAIYRSRGSTIPETELRAITLGQISDLAALIQQVLAKAVIEDRFVGRVGWNNVNMYHIDPNFVKPLTLDFRCSFVELVASGPQPPRWFVSHWWGTAFHQTVALLNFHASQRSLSMETPYWICTFANNQHDLSALSGSLYETPFVKAILSRQCSGTLTLLDQNVTTLERVWCVLENFVSTNVTHEREKEPEHLIDVAAWLPEGSGTFGGKPVPAKPTLRLDLGAARMKEVVEDEESGGAFPLSVSGKGSTVDVKRAKASRKEDRLRILHLIAGTPEDEWDEDPPKTCDAYENLNKAARRLFAAGAMYGAALSGDVKELERLLGEFPHLKDEGISDGAAPVYAAAFKNSVPALQILLDARVNPNVQKEDGASPVFIAAQAGNIEALQMLLDARADPNLARGAGVTPAFMAVQGKHNEALAALLTANADPNTANDKGVSPLLLAAQLGSLPATKDLLEAKADPNQATANGNTPLSVAASNGVRKALKSAGASEAGASPINAAALSSMCAMDNLFAGVDAGNGPAAGGGQPSGNSSRRASSSSGAATGKAKAAPRRRQPACPQPFNHVYEDMSDSRRVSASVGGLYGALDEDGPPLLRVAPKAKASAPRSSSQPQGKKKR
mmetsp:Transcript_89191/g.170916  ORF Transcript_89191/g.170916 Transcript_89191/m.170916 type:complete len:650 (-) Transcript_89191:82-2031(-)